jgi:hypothetical protein
MGDVSPKMIAEISKVRFLEAPQVFRAGLERRHLSLTKVRASGVTIHIELFRR